MTIVAPVNKWQYRRLLLIFVVLLGAAGWFTYDGWLGWPRSDDRRVKHMEHSRYVTARQQTVLARWPGWQAATAAQRLKMDRLVHAANFTGWHSVTDIHNQRWIAAALGIVSVVVLLWCGVERRRRITVDDAGLRLSGGCVIAFDDIVRIDNRRWSRDGLVMLAYRRGGKMRQAKLDGVVFDNLGVLLNAVAARAVKAEITPPP